MNRPALATGKPRLGTVFFHARDSGRPAMVFDNGNDIELTVNLDRGDPLSRRFTGRSMSYGDDPAYERFDYSLPNQVWFVDPHGVICLVEPHGRSHTFGALVEGRLRFLYALEVGNVGVDYESINAMQSRVEGLEEWIPIGSIVHDFAGDGSSGDASTFKVVRKSPVAIARRLNAQIRPTYSFRSSSIPGQTKLHDEVRVRTSASKARPWHEHLDVHQGVRELIVVAGWEDYGIWDLTVSRRDDPERALAGNPLHERWAKVATHAVSERSGSGKRNRFLFDYDDAGDVGLRRWLRLRNEHRRGIAGMIHSVGMQGVALETAITEAGAALEYIGYQIAVERREVPGRRLERHLRRIAEQGACDMGIDLDTWPTRFADAYNTVKHPDRMSDWSALDLSNILRESRLLFRSWVGRRMGVKPAVLERNRGIVPMSRPYERW